MFIDRNLPQQVHINWSLVTRRDSDSGAPDERDEGFWPSRDKDAPGYVDPKDFDVEYGKAAARMAAWRRDEWEYVGVIAHATILIPIGGKSFRIMEIESAGIWGIESDSDDYIKTVYEEQQRDLLGELTTFAAAIASNGAIQTDNY